MRKVVLSALLLLCSVALISGQALAQTKLIHYWNFNSYTSGYTVHLPSYSSIAATYSTIDTNKARWVFKPLPSGVSAGYLSYSDISAAAVADYDTVNTQFGSPAGNYFRARNPNDSMWLLVYMPTTNYQNITLKFATETSSLASGDSAQIYSYSVDSGVTWSNTGLTIKSFANTSANLTFGPVTIGITDPAAFNNPKLVFRILTAGHNTGTSGNNRFDNVTVSGDTILPSGSLIYFWHFNTFTGSYLNPNFPYLAADYFINSAHDSSKAKVHMGLFPGTSLSNPTYFDNVPYAVGDVNYDTVNSNWSSVPALGIVPPGNGIRMRNPNDSTYLYYYMPTTNYKNILLKFAVQTSSLTSGDSIELYNYSIDSGVTWRQSGISEALDSAFLAGMPTGTIPFRTYPITINFTDPAAFNNPKLVFRIHLAGRNTGASGNNRFDNISVQGDSIISPMPTITTTPTAFGPLCNSANSTIYVPFTTTGSVSGPYHVQISNALGVFPANFTSNIIDSFSGGSTTSPITAIVPAGTAPGSIYRVRVVSPNPGIYGSDNGSNILLTGVAGPISGPGIVCANGANITLVESGAGTWSSSNTAIGTVGSTTGVVTGLTPGNTTITFTVGVGCTTSTVVTVNPVPSAITGQFNECIGVATTLGDVTIGSWSSSAPAVATIGSGTGAVNPIAVGTSIITYTGTNSCYITQQVTVNANPSAISGSAPVCVGNNVTLTDAGGGTWSSSNALVGSVGSATGTVAGVSNGVVTITYTLATGCIATVPFTVNANPAVINGASTGCIGVPATLTDATAFGAWSSSAPGVATVGSSTGVVIGAATGSTTISYTLSTGCYTTKSITINSLPSAITGVSVICAGATTALANTTPGGSWSSSNTAVATVDGSGNVTGIVAGTPTITYQLPTGCMAVKTITVNPLPAPVTGQFSLYCLPSSTTLADITPGGTWSSSTPAVATIGTGTGLVTGVTAGTTTISYTLSTGCAVSVIETVNPTPAAISGNANACVGATTNYTDATAFGAWSSSNTSVITVGSGTGIATGVAVGTANIVYTVSTGCVITKSVTVNPLPLAIAGTLQACAAGATSALSDPTTGGIWSSSISSLASVDGSGLVTGVAAGNSTISYTLPTGCFTTAAFTVNPLPAPIGGVTSVYCIGSTALLADFVSGGTWSSSNPAVATIDGTGLVTGVAAGSSTISYVLPTGCYVTYVENITSTPAPITGTPTTCISTNTTFSDVTAFGAWSSSNPAVATIGSGTGVVTGVASGITTITYELSPSCLITRDVTVNPQPSAISGTAQVCIGGNTTLTDAGGGSWTSSIPALATIGAGTGVVTGIVAGTVDITYTLPTGCATTTGLTVNPLPLISGANSICLGLPSPLVGNIPGGTWTSSNLAVATIGSSTGLVSAVTLGTTDIMYVLPTGCMATMTVSVNPPPAAITGDTRVCLGSTTTLSGIGGGGWYSSNPSVASVGFGTGIVSGVTLGTATITYSLGTSCISLATVTVNALPSAITGTGLVCQNGTSTLGDITPGGSWTSNNTSLATVGSASGIVAGVASGFPTITYTVDATGCISVKTITVNPVAPITGIDNVCTGLAIVLANSLPAGTWTSSAPGTATVGTSSGVVTGVTGGIADITYTLPTGCPVAATITVNTNPAAVVGNPNVCLGATNLLSNATPGGTWSSTSPFVALVVPGSGAVTGSTLGTSTINYTLSTGCMSSLAVTVDPLPASITGTMNACVGLTSTLADATTGGTWTSSVTSFATVGGSTGIVTGVTAGAPVITYTLPTGCYATATFVVKPLPAAYTVTGGGSFCSGGAGLHIGLSNSDSGISYQLYLGTATVGSAMPGTGSSLDFGLKTAGGVYTIVATNTVSGCTKNMTGSQTIVAIPLPNAFHVTGGGGYCATDSGKHVGLNNSDSTIHYQLFNGVTPVGSFMGGTGSALDFGLITAPGVYRVIATNPATTCTRNMLDSANIFIDTLVPPTVTITHSPTVLRVGKLDTLTAHVTGVPTGTTISYQWVNNETYVAGATTNIYSGNVFYDKDSITILVTSTSMCGTIITPKSVILTLVDDAVNPVSFAGSLKLIPNPNNGTFTVKGSIGVADGAVSLEVMTVLGQVIYTKDATINAGEIDEQLMIGGNLANGMYLLNVRSGAAQKVFHFVVRQ